MSFHTKIQAHEDLGESIALESSLFLKQGGYCMVSVLGLIGSLALLIYLTMRGINIIIAAVGSAVILALTGGLNLIDA